jgi:ABC-2 type transport system permease protein
MPNFRESDPSKIAAGFGGTLNLVAGLLFLLLVLGLMAAPWHLGMMVRELGEQPTLSIAIVVSAGIVLGLAVGAASVLFPLRAGIKALREMEF